MLYKLLGFVVWRAARRYVRRRVARPATQRRMLAGALAAGAAGAAGVAAARRA